MGRKMKGINRRGIRVCLGLVALAAIGAVPALSSGASASPTDSKGSDSNLTALAVAECHKEYASGTGNATFSWCFSGQGTINRLVSPPGYSHVFAEGFAVCSASRVHGWAYDVSSGSGLGAPTYPAANKVRHQTTDGKFRIEQTFTQDATNKSIFVTVKLTRLGTGTLNNVKFSRMIDFDLNGSAPGDNWIQSYASVLATELQGSSYTGTTWNIGRISAVEPFSGASQASTCNATPAATPVNGDYVGRVVYDLKAMGPNVSKTFVYRINQL